MLFLRKISTGMNHSIWILPGISGFSIQMVTTPGLPAGKFAWTHPREMEGFCRVLSSAKSFTKSPTLMVGGWARPPRGLLVALRPFSRPTLVPWSSFRLPCVVRRSSGLVVARKEGKKRGFWAWEKREGRARREAYLQKLQMTSKHLKPNVITVKSLLHLEKKINTLGPSCSKGR